MDQRTLFGIVLVFACSGCAPVREDVNPVTQGQKGEIDVGLTANLLYGQGVELRWTPPNIDHLETVRLYRGKGDQDCHDLSLLSQESPHSDQYLDTTTQPDTQYSYCITAASGEKETARNGTPTVMATFRQPAFVLNLNKYWAPKVQVPIAVNHHSELFTPATLIVSVNQVKQELAFANQTTLTLSNSNGKRQIQLSLADSSGQETLAQNFVLYLCQENLTENDQDGYPAGDTQAECPGLELDCDDNADSIFPGANEACDGLDQDCDGVFDNGFDTDDDTYTSCGTLTTDGSSVKVDCDDQDEAIYPGADETCDGKDQDCDGMFDEPFDKDADTYTICGTRTADGSATESDCNDEIDSIYPGATEDCDRVDQNCDGVQDDDIGPCDSGSQDNDGDLFGSMASGGTDCDDADDEIHPGAIEICADTIDHNCDDSIICDGGAVDDDQDSYASVESGGTDCDDSDPQVNPGALEICEKNGDLDNNCDGSGICDGGSIDGDSDGYASVASGGTDCDDTQSSIFPRSYAEKCEDGNDWDCDANDLTCDSWVTHLKTPNDLSNRTGHTVVWTGQKMIIWGGGAQGSNTGAVYDPYTDTWTATSMTNVPEPRTVHTAVWTGYGMLIWGGAKDCGIYYPLTDSWTLFKSSGPLGGERQGHTAVWTGEHMLIWGGVDSSGFDDGAVYDPLEDTWERIQPDALIEPRWGHTAIWTGDKMIVWGGQHNPASFLESGGIYDPATKTWQQTTFDNAPSARRDHTAVWTGERMIIWGGSQEEKETQTGRIYDPIQNSWESIVLSGAPIARKNHTAIWNGNYMIVWGGLAGIGAGFYTGGLFDPVAKSWLVTSIRELTSGRAGHTAVWTGDRMIVWGGGSNQPFVYTPPAE